MQLVLGALVAYRLIYHSIYVRDVPFALATFSDGRQYELAALDILAAAPLGTEPFYLQGLYAYFMALPMMLAPWVSLAILLQLVVAGLASWGFFRATAWWLGRPRAAWSTAVLLAYPALAFYENKVLTAALAVATSVLVLLTVARAQARPGIGRIAVVGFALGLAVLARPNALVAVPFVLWAIVLISQPGAPSRPRAIAAVGVGLLLSLGPMAMRNAVVTGSPTVLPAHGGGTSFYIGNNRHARGVWNDAGGLMSGEVAHERVELAARLGIDERSGGREAAAIGQALYRRAFAEIREDPSRWVWLLVRKLGRALGNDELTQDYDWWGEREMLPWAHRIPVPFGVVLALGCVGAVVLRRRIRERRAERDDEPDARPLAWTLVGLAAAVLAANIGYFTSSQHRLPLVVPLAVLAGLGVPALRDAVIHLAKRRDRWSAMRLVGLAVVLLGVASVPRAKRREVSAAHDYNLAVAWLRLGEPDMALEALDRAVERRPGHPLIRLERATLRRERGDFEGARADLDHIVELDSQPQWVRHRVELERHRAADAPFEETF
jgi:4-amino-4-deoxy-L-arabinose transferase-like glycosyltransferase